MEPDTLIKKKRRQVRRQHGDIPDALPKPIKIAIEKPKRKPGRPKTPDALSPHYTRRSISLPAQAFKNLDKLANRLNARAKSGPNYGKASWRNWLRIFSLEDIPEILALLDAHPIEVDPWKSLKLTVNGETHTEGFDEYLADHEEAYVESPGIDVHGTEIGAHANGTV